MSEPDQPLDDRPITKTRASSKLDWAKIDVLLEHASKRTGFPGFVLAVISLVVALISLCYVIANYRLQKTSDRPFLASYGISEISPNVRIGWNNVGKKTARRGTATLYAMRKAHSPPEKLGASAIVGGGTNIFPGFGSQAYFELPKREVPPFYLLCVVYFDDTGTQFEQAFLFSNRGPPDRFEEVDPPDIEQCR
jgi:hypothetical protein